VVVIGSYSHLKAARRTSPLRSRAMGSYRGLGKCPRHADMVTANPAWVTIGGVFAFLVAALFLLGGFV
ncbi:MAG: hypothetical protein JWP44_4573, partial [Mucilaginibacter sp.]|nr:hypothetical protein [Mucilaginibacter sp.]